VLLGKTNVTAHASSSVPIALLSNTDLTNVSFQVEFPVMRLQNLTLEPLLSQIGTAAISPISANRASVQLSATPGQILPGGKELARLHFTADGLDNSAVVPLRVTDLAGVRASGDVLLNATAQGGRVFLVGREPLLDASVAANGSRELILYGPVLHTYEIQYRTSLSPGSAWTKLATVSMTKDWALLPPPDSGSQTIFYRALEIIAGQPMFTVSPGPGASWTISLHAEPGKTYWLESQPNLGTGTWSRESKITLQNPVQALDGLIRIDGVRFFRVVEGDSSD